MMAKFFRCMNCLDDKQIPGRDFVAESAPVCPKCGLDGSPGKQHANLIIPLRTVHFDPPHPTVKNRGVNVPLCGVPFVGGMAMTGDPNVANCPNCKAHADFERIKAAWNVGADDFVTPGDYQITPEHGKG